MGKMKEKPVLPDQSLQKDSKDAFASSTLEYLAKTRRFTIVDDHIEPIKVIDVAWENGHYRVWFQFEDGERKFCLLPKVTEKLFDSEESAAAHLPKLPDAPLAPIVQQTACKAETIYVLRSNSQYVIGFHETKHYESDLRGYSFRKRSSSYIRVQVPDFGDIHSALKLYTKEDAEKVASDITNQFGYQLEVVRYTNALAEAKS